jgi:hypothetical protein
MEGRGGHPAVFVLLGHQCVQAGTAGIPFYKQRTTPELNATQQLSKTTSNNHLKVQSVATYIFGLAY